MAEIASAYVSLIPSAKGFGSKMDSEISPQLNSAGKRGGLSFGKLFAAGAALGIGTKVFSFLGDSLGEAREAQKVGALTESIIKSTGKAAGITAGEVGKMAGRLSAVTGIDDEVIQQGSNLLLTFKNVKNYVDGEFVGVFDRATASAVDLSAAGFGSVDGAAKMLGKALNDPLKGISALGRAGVTFTEQQQKQIKALVETGQAAQAQGLILAEVESQVGGAAAATATASEKAAVAAGNLKEQIGTALIPVADRLSNLFTTKIAPAISTFVKQMSNGRGAGGQFAEIMRGVAAAAQAVFKWVSGSVVPAIRDALIPVIKKGREAFAELQKKIRDNQPEVNQLVAAFKTVATFVGTKVIPTLYRLHGEQFVMLVRGASAVIAALAAGVRAFNSIREAITNGANAVDRFGASVREKVTNAISTIQGIPGRITAVFSGASTLLYNAGVLLMSGLAAGIRNRISAAIAEVQAGLTKIKNMLPGSPIKDGPLKPWNGGRPGELLMDMLAFGIRKGAKKTREAMEKALDGLKSKFEGFKSEFASLAESVAGAFTGDLFNVTATAADAEAGIAGSTVGQNFINGLLGKKSELTGLLASFKTLQGWGLDPKFLSQLFASGNGGLITELAGMGQGAALSTAGLFGEVTNLGAQLGGAVAANDFGPNIDAVATEIKGLREDIKKAPKDTGKEVADRIKDAKFVVEGDGAGQRAYLRTGRRN